MRGEWLRRHPSSPADARSALVAIPHAGGGPSVFGDLAGRLGDDVALWTAELPGRERRFGEPPVSDVDTVVRALADEIATSVSTPFTLLGHSMGALLAFETARELRRSGRRLPAKLIAVVSTAPDAEPDPVPRHLLSDDELLAWLRGLGNLPAALEADREVVDQVLAVARADLRAAETYHFVAEAPLPLPVTAIAGESDPSVSELDAAGWRRHTSAEFRLEVLPGGHFPALRLDSYAPRIIAELPRAAAAGDASSETIATVTEIWEDVLGLAGIQPDEDFFDLGGYSLVATTVVSRCSKAFGTTVPVHLVFDHPVLAEFAERVEELVAQDTAPAVSAVAQRQEGSLSSLLDEFEQQMSASADVS
ncbi:thioesterase II family protein [Kutzneria sp. CA-103260]|uniref:thioesterase II family protein n=1 Tax=Kutzneria sp. CA-103260 TaxID=2802641 RepID=UPI001BABE366|nr:alpha/beta fold hydrolase [Kutzneria sp. CA-103260]QUQ67043.1 Thioesterase domain protein [Kutzneria sp. CA-103260]